MTDGKPESLARKTFSNLAWKFAERIGAQSVKLVVSLVLARILLPSDYGTVALVSVFISILNVFIDSGLGTALIQKKDADDTDFSTVFYFNIVVCALLYSAMFFAAPSIAKFYGSDGLAPVIRVLSVTLLISGVKNVQQAYVSKTLIFKKFFFATLCGTLGAAVLGIFLACKGFGVWALVAQQVFNSAVDTFALWITVKWRPSPAFSFSRLKILFSYGWKLLVASLLHTVYMDIRSLVIGKRYSSSDLAFFNKGKEFPEFVVSNINTSIDSVLLPVMSMAQDERERLKSMTRRSIMVSSFAMWPLMSGLAAVGNTAVPLLLTDKWLPCLPYLYILCFTNGTEPLTTANLNAIRALGRSDLILKMEMIKKTIALAIVLCAMPFGVLAIALSGILYNFVAIGINTFPNKRLLGYSLGEMLRDIMPSFLISLAMFLIVYAMNFVAMNLILRLVLQVAVGGSFYVGLSRLLRLEVFGYVSNAVANFFKGRIIGGYK